MMAQMSCCGVDNYKDFPESPKWIIGNKTIPDACCVLDGEVSLFKVKDPQCPYNPTEENSYYQKVNYLSNQLSPFEDFVLASQRFIVLYVLRVASRLWHSRHNLEAPLDGNADKIVTYLS